MNRFLDAYILVRKLKLRKMKNWQAMDNLARTSLNLQLHLARWQLQYASHV